MFVSQQDAYIGSYATLPAVLFAILEFSFESDGGLGCSVLALVASALGVLVSVGWKATCVLWTMY